MLLLGPLFGAGAVKPRHLAAPRGTGFPPTPPLPFSPRGRHKNISPLKRAFRNLVSAGETRRAEQLKEQGIYKKQLEGNGAKNQREEAAIRDMQAREVPVNQLTIGWEYYTRPYPEPKLVTNSHYKYMLMYMAVGN